MAPDASQATVPESDRAIVRVRARVLSPWLLMLLALAVVGVLAAAYPRNTLQQRLLESDKPNALSVAYLEAWLRVAPDDHDFIGVLAAQYLRVGRFDDAERLAQRMARSGDAELVRSAVLVQAGVEEARAYGMLEDNPARPAAMDRLRAAFDEAATFKWRAGELRVLAQRSTAAGANRAALAFYQQLATVDHDTSLDSQMHIAQLALGSQAYDVAAQAYFSAQSASADLDTQRKYFMAALAAYQAGGLLDQALADGDKHLGRLSRDPQTIAAMLNLARAANRPDMIRHYAKALSDLTSAIDRRQGDENGDTEGKQRLAEVRMAASRRGVRRVADHGHSPRWHTVVAHPGDYGDWYYADGFAAMQRNTHSDGHFVRVADTASAVNAVNAASTPAVGTAGHASSADSATAASANAASTKADTSSTAASSARPAMSAQDREQYDELAYKSFLEGNDVHGAMALAQRRVTADPSSADWQRKLAQSAEWSNEPMIALQAWLAVAKLTNASDAWAEVLRIAPALNDDEAYVLALLKQSDLNPGDLKRIDAVVDAYERLGEPDEALAFLKRRAVGPVRIAVLRRYAALAERSGNDDLAEATYKQLVQTTGPNAEDSLHLASLYYAHRDYEGAYGALKVAAPVAKPANDDFWRTYGQIARLLEDEDGAHLAYGKLLAGGHATDEDLGEMSYFYDGHPLDAGRIAELQYRNTGTPRALTDTVYYYVQARAWPRIKTLLASLTPKERAIIDNSPDSLSMVAEYERQTNQPDAALRDLRRASSLPAASSDVQAAYLWTVVDFGTDDELHLALLRWRDRSNDVAALWGPYAAGLVRLNKPNDALQYFRREAAASKGDPLWVLALADCEEAAGHDDLAWSLRRHVWTTMLPADPDAMPLGNGLPRRGRLSVSLSNDDIERRDEIRQRRAALSQLFENGDTSKRVLIEMLRADGDQGDTSQMQASVLGNVGKLPPVAEANVARVPVAAAAGGVATADAPTQQDADDDTAGDTSGKGKIAPGGHAAAGAIGTSSASANAAADRAYADAKAAGAPAAVAQQQRLISSAAVEVTVAWALSAESNEMAKAWLAREYANRLTRPVDAELSVALSEHDVKTINRILDSKGASRATIDNRIDAYEMADRPGEAEELAFYGLGGAPANEDIHERLSNLATERNQSINFGFRSMSESPLDYYETKLGGELALTDHWSVALEGIQLNQWSSNKLILADIPSRDRRYEFTGHYQTTTEDISLVFGHRTAMTEFNTERLTAEFGRGTALRSTFTIGRNQFADESQEIQVGGMKDMLRGEVEWDVVSSVYVRGAFEGDRFYTQERDRIGSGALMDGEIGYRIRTEYPDWTIRIVGTHGNYSAYPINVPFLQRLIPIGDVPTASTFIPQSYSQYGLAAGFGTDLLDRYTRAWRPFLDVGLIHDSNFGWGPEVLAGFAGSVFGNDHAAVYFQHESVSHQGTDTNSFGVRYQWLF
ncbi:polysaccharide biosynthesis protein PelB [Pararobbsia alpina]|uniref:tetratricopeptide repeat protein n=1 Tax=Pararobbsia alpina TaxID=621374 RepID=UPI0039A5C3FA